MVDKKVVKYSDVGNIVEGHKVWVVAVDHTSPLVTNGEVAITSVVESYDSATGIFETQNSIYKPNILLG